MAPPSSRSTRRWRRRARSERAAGLSWRVSLARTAGSTPRACWARVGWLLSHDFSVRYVAENNATTTPPFIGAISLWAALEGSILFWALLATGWASLVLWRHRDRHRSLMPWVGATLATVKAFFFAVM